MGAVAEAAQALDRLGQRILFAAKTARARRAYDESPAADFAAGFETAINLQQADPGRQALFSRQHAMEHDAPAAQQLAGDSLGGFVARDFAEEAGLAVAAEERPAAGGLKAGAHAVSRHQRMM